MLSKKPLLYTLLFCLLLSFNSYSQIKELREWLKIPKEKRPFIENLDFAKQNLSVSESEAVLNLLLADKQSDLINTYGKQWDERLIELKDLKMPFYYHIFGDEPSNGRSLIFSLHGGGNAPAEVNDQQYNNQKHLYDTTMKTQEGIYMALRAPTNTWDLWHQNHIDDFLNILIQLAVIKENVNPNKVYIMGYSAGGDGLYQLAPRLADRWAAASMMAGHPGDASALSLRNLPFTIHMGALDKAYNRNNLARKWGVVLDSLQNSDPEAYFHDVQVHEGLGHWMKLKDSVAIPWMKKYKRNPIPRKIVWVQDNRHHDSFYWLGTPTQSIQNYGKVVAEYSKRGNSINIIESYTDSLKVFLNDKMLDLDKRITIKKQGSKIFKGKLKRTILSLYKTLNYKGDVNLAFPTSVSINCNKVY